jgi:GntR family transcriptional regulator
VALVLAIDPAQPVPIYVQLERAIRAAMATGRLPIGEQLPTVRQLAVDLRINANTVARVYAELERSGLLETRRGIGTFVAAVPAPAAQSRRDHAQLRAMAARWLEEAAAAGFSPEDVERQLTLLLKKA